MPTLPAYSPSPAESPVPQALAGSPMRCLQSHLELLFLEHVRVGRIENVICQLGLAVNVYRSGGLAAQEFTENLPGPARELTGRKV